MKLNKTLLTSIAALSVATKVYSGNHGIEVIPDYQKENPWFTAGLENIDNKVFSKFPKAKNVILFVGDGMGVSTVTGATRV